MFVLALLSMVMGIVAVAFYANGYRATAAVLAIIAIGAVSYSRMRRNRSLASSSGRKG